MKIAVCFDNIGPYHLARLKNLSHVADLSVVQYRSESEDYQWLSENDFRIDIHTVRKKSSIGSLVSDRKLISEIMRSIKPDVLLIPGWASTFSHMLMRFSLKAGIPMVVMSDSQEIDFPRTKVKEWLKGRLVSLFSSALVAGQRHKDYLIGLDFDAGKINIGYDVVDNDYFAKRAIEINADSASHRAEFSLPDRYILCCARFVEKKNLNYLVESYAMYLTRSADSSGSGALRDLVIVGDGPLREQLICKIEEFGMSNRIHLPGFVQYKEIPAYYALADCFVLPSVSEQWGLVVNEAMASGLPVIVSERCGCSADLVEPGVNGLLFNPETSSGLADALNEIFSDEEALSRKSKESRRIISNWTLDRFSQSLVDCAHLAVSNPVKTRHSLGRLVLSIINARLR